MTDPQLVEEEARRKQQQEQEQARLRDQEQLNRTDSAPQPGVAADTPEPGAEAPASRVPSAEQLAERAEETLMSRLEEAGQKNFFTRGVSNILKTGATVYNTASMGVNAIRGDKAGMAEDLDDIQRYTGNSKSVIGTVTNWAAGKLENRVSGREGQEENNLESSIRDGAKSNSVTRAAVNALDATRTLRDTGEMALNVFRGNKEAAVENLEEIKGHTGHSNGVIAVAANWGANELQVLAKAELAQKQAAKEEAECRQADPNANSYNLLMGAIDKIEKNNQDVLQNFNDQCGKYVLRCEDDLPTVALVNVQPQAQQASAGQAR
jgi:hypothetical protein